MNGEPLRVLIVCQGDLAGASEKQALGFAEQLAQSGHEVMLSLRGDPATAAREGAGGVPGLTVRFHGFRGPRLRRGRSMAAFSNFLSIVFDQSRAMPFGRANRHASCDARR